MASEWKRVCLADVVEIVSGGTPKTTVPDYWGGDIPWLSVSDFNTGYRWVSSAEKYITQRGLSESATTLLNQGDIIISARGTVGALAQLARSMAFNQSCYGLRGKKGIAETDYIYYVLRKSVTDMKHVAHGGVFDTITRDTFRIIECDLPPLPEQRSIAHILGTLDDKIELNRRMSRTLEDIARALFESWFVRFDPVRRNMARRQRGQTSPEQRLPSPSGRGEGGEGVVEGTAFDHLFPHRLVDSELGEIPEGWRVDVLGNILELVYGKGLREQDRRSGPIPVFGSNGQVGWHDEKLVDGPGIIVGRKGNPGIVTWSYSDFFPIDTTFYVVPKQKELSLYFLFYALQSHDLPSLGADSAVPGLNRNLAYLNKQVMPSFAILKAFDSLVSSIFDRIQASNVESRTLAALRDALLPKLISGEIRVKDAERFLKERGL